MSDRLILKGVEPPYAIPGGEIIVSCEGFRLSADPADGVFIAGVGCRIVAASSSRILAIVPEDVEGTDSPVQLFSDGAASNISTISIGRRLAAGMHIVANPAIDPSDGALILTRSGSRGQHLPATLFRLETDGYLDELPEPILNPTGIAFDGEGRMYVTNRAQGEVYSVGRDGSATVFSAGLGIATGIAFDVAGRMFVGDRGGTIYRVNEYGDAEIFTIVEASVAAFHLAFGPDGRLYVTSPGLSSFDRIHAIGMDGGSENYFTGLGRPQGLAFDRNGYLYAAACYRGRHGIVKIGQNGANAEHFVAGSGIVGLCFTAKGEMIVATGSDVYSINCGIFGTLLPDR